VEDALRERWYTPLLYGCRILLNLMLFSTITLLSVLTAFSSPLLLPVSEPPVPEKEGLELSVQELLNQKDAKSEQLNTTETKVENKEKIWKCKGCNQTETYALNFLQKQGIKDKNALATIMGNIKQESGFVPNICEGGARIKYESCRSGGFGIIQFTDAARYDGLGKFAYRTGGNPSSIDTQLKYMLHEVDWKMIEPRMKTPGKSIDQYMYYASKWIRWGHHGARTDFAYNYSRKLILTEVSS
jgi:hypothetical protein